MFLALTPLDVPWETDEETLLVGPWCVPYERRHELESGRFRTLPSPWQDRERLRQASVYADGACRRLLGHLTVSLNRALDVQEPVEYWRVLVGPWLMHFVHSLYDRRAHLAQALAGRPGMRAVLLAEESFRTPATTFEALVGMTQEDHYNWQLFSELLGLMPEGRDVRISTRSAPAPAPAQSRPRASWKTRAAGVARANALRLMAGRRAWVTEVTAPKMSMLSVVARSGFRAIPAPVWDELGEWPRQPIALERRRALADAHTEPLDDFEALCLRMLPRHLPSIYVEGFERARWTVRRRYPRTPSWLVSETGWYVNETYKYLAAQAVAAGSRLAGVQHGAGYGLLTPMAIEAYERSITQTYFVWGWAGDDPLLQNVPHPIVSGLPQPERQTTARLLFATQNLERYMQRLGSTPGGSLWPPQMPWQRRFVEALPERLREPLVVRLPPYDHRQGDGPNLREAFPRLAVDTYRSFKDSAAHSRVTILERPGTCVLESLAMNAPTVMFWDYSLWGFRDDARPYLDALRRAGILWDSPEAAAGHVAAIYDDCAAWWSTGDVQSARRAFVERYALSRHDWIGEWADALRRTVLGTGHRTLATRRQPATPATRA